MKLKQLAGRRPSSDALEAVRQRYDAQLSEIEEERSLMLEQFDVARKDLSADLFYEKKQVDCAAMKAAGFKTSRRMFRGKPKEVYCIPMQRG